MSHNTSRLAALAALALLVGALACSDRAPGTAPDAAGARDLLPGTATVAKPELLARSFALALSDPAFRANLKAQLDRSPFREHKLSFQRFLAGEGGRALSAMARGTGLSQVSLARAAGDAIPLELYLPVPAHRRAWAGGESVLVATAIADHDVPVAFDVRGNRQLLDPERPPATPVIAVVPVETDFATLRGLISAYGPIAVAKKLESEPALIRLGFQPFAVFLLAEGAIPLDTADAFDRHAPPGPKLITVGNPIQGFPKLPPLEAKNALRQAEAERLRGGTQ